MESDEERAESNTRHIPVLLSEVLHELAAERPGAFLDCTFGGGGHTRAILEANTENRVFAFDRDPSAVERGAELVKQYAGRLVLAQGCFSELADLLVEQTFDGVLADLGVSTDQLFANRGFSFYDTDDLDMRMDQSAGASASELLNTLPQSELNRLLREGGVGTEASYIAGAVLKARPIESARQLADLVSRVVGHRWKKSTHPATVVFQALRIAVNSERSEVDSLLELLPAIANPGCRVAIITFHSLEDRWVTGQLRAWAQGDTTPARLRGGALGLNDPARLGELGELFGATAKEEEVEGNPSARSARLRSFLFKE